MPSLGRQCPIQAPGKIVRDVGVLCGLGGDLRQPVPCGRMNVLWDWLLIRFFPIWHAQERHVILICFTPFYLEDYSTRFRHERRTP